jgi:predicted metal-dependent hydrolase
MPYNNGQTMTLRGPGGYRVKVRLEVNAKARRLIIRLDERRREAVAVAPSSRQIEAAAAFAAERVDWISSRLQHLPEIVRFEEGAIFQYRGEPCCISAEGEGPGGKAYSRHTPRPVRARGS